MKKKILATVLMTALLGLTACGSKTAESDLDYIKNQAMEQTDAGAEILDVNVGLPGIDEKALMTEVVKELQSVVSTPLNIDSSDPAVI